MGDTETHGAVFVLVSSLHVCSWLRRPVVNDEIEICLHCTPGFHGKSLNACGAPGIFVQDSI